MAYYVPVPEPVPTIEVDANETLRPEDGHVETESLAETDNSFQTTNTGVTYHFPTTPDSSGTETPGLNGVDRNGLARQGSF
jgi:hypothetical protein